MSSKRQATDDINDQPSQRPRADQTHLPMLLLQVWPQLVVDYREARDEARAQVATLRSLLDEQLDELVQTRESLTAATAEVANYHRLAVTLQAIVNELVLELPPVRRRVYNIRYQSAIQDFDATAVIDLTTDEQVEEEED